MIDSYIGLCLITAVIVIVIAIGICGCSNDFTCLSFLKMKITFGV